LSANVAQTVAGERVTFTAKPPTSKKYVRLSAKQKRKARLVLQRRDGATWRTVASKKVAKKVVYSTSVPTSATVAVRYRTRAMVGRKAYPAGALRLPVVAQSVAAVPDTLDADSAQSYAVTTTPARAGRSVVLERYVDGAWSTVSSATTTAGGTAALAAPAVGYPAWYRVTAGAWNGIPATSAAPVVTSLSRTPTEIAHRAGADLAPEQTLAALDASLAAGATAMEIDVQLTSDGVPVILHDAGLARTTNVEDVFPARAGDPLGTFTWAEVQQLDAGSWKGPQWAGEKIPSLDQWLTRLNGRAHLVLEVKFWPNNIGSPAQQTALRQMLDEQLDTGLLGDLAEAGTLTVSSFNHGFLEPFALAHPEVPVGALAAAPPSGSALVATAVWAEEVHSNVTVTSKATTDAVRAAGMTTSVWTILTHADYRRALASHAERIITDHPGRLAEVLAPPAPPD
jgi:glycerophosphoryl diester phosphodiesterase